MTPDATGAWPLPEPYDFFETTRWLRMGVRDPTLRRDGTALWRTAHTAEGPVTVRLVPGMHLQADAWGPGAAAVMQDIPRWAGLHEDAWTLPPHPVVDRLLRAHPGVRLTDTGDVFEAMVSVVLQQLVTWEHAAMTWRRLCDAHGAPAPGPGPTDLRLSPTPAAIRAAGTMRLEAVGIGGKQARTLMTVAGVAHAMQRARGMDTPEATAWLQKVRGIGPGRPAWSSDSGSAAPSRCPSATSTCRTRWPGRWPARPAPATSGWPHCSHRSRGRPSASYGWCGPRESRPRDAVRARPGDERDTTRPVDHSPAERLYCGATRRLPHDPVHDQPRPPVFHLLPASRRGPMRARPRPSRVARRCRVSPLVSGSRLARRPTRSEIDHPLAAHVAHRPQKAPPAAPTTAFTPRFFDAHQFATLTVVSELIVPGSVASGSPAYIDEVLAVEHDDVRLRVVSALAAVDAAAREGARHHVPCRPCRAAGRDRSKR